jgi:hypothetical protein
MSRRINNKSEAWMSSFAKLVSSLCFGVIAAMSSLLTAAQPAQAQGAASTFFVTSNGLRHQQR